MAWYDASTRTICAEGAELKIECRFLLLTGMPNRRWLNMSDFLNEIFAIGQRAEIRSKKLLRYHTIRFHPVASILLSNEVDMKLFMFTTAGIVALACTACTEDPREFNELVVMRE